MTGGELARKAVHVAIGGIAFAVRPLGLVASLAAALLAVLHNAFLLPRYGGKRLWRAAESAGGFSLGIVLYPITVLLLLAIYARRLEVATAVWGLLAFGDGMAGIAGPLLGRSNPLPWNRGKSWAGSLAYFLCGGAAAYALLLWTAPGRYPPAFALAVAAVAAGFAAALESLPQGLDDNLGVPLVTSVLLFCLTLTVDRWSALPASDLLARLAIGGPVNLALALAAWALGGVGLGGAVTGVLLGTVIWTFAGWGAFALLFAFFFLGTLATKLGYARKAGAGIAQERGGRRGPGNALAKVSVPALAALFAATTPYPELFLVALAGAFATAASDTVSSEIGKAFGRRTFLITTLAPVPRGTDGAVSLEGTLAGLAAGLLVGALGAAVGLYPVSWVAIVGAAALVATTLESLVGATLERRGLLDNEAVNFLNSLAGALLAAGGGVLLAS